MLELAPSMAASGNLGFAPFSFPFSSAVSCHSRSTPRAENHFPAEAHTPRAQALASWLPRGMCKALGAKSIAGGSPRETGVEPVVVCVAVIGLTKACPLCQSDNIESDDEGLHGVGAKLVLNPAF